MAEPLYRAIAGRAVLVGKQPDGDSVRFVPEDPSLLQSLQYGERVRISADGSVQLRFDGIDAPELHYQGVAQPLGARARDQLLQHLGFADVVFMSDGETVGAATPTTVPVVVLAQLVEVNGRPVSVVFTDTETALPPLTSGQQIELTPELLRASTNYWAAVSGTAYPLLYTSTDAELRDTIRTAARDARTQQLGVWGLDSTSSFPVDDLDALETEGALIWPKLFRRAADYLRQRTTGQTLPDWLATMPLQDDEVYPTPDTTTALPVLLHTLLSQTDQQVHFAPDPIDLTVVER